MEIKYWTKQTFIIISRHKHWNIYINKCIIKIESNDKLKEIDIKNRKCYNFDDIIKTEDFDPDNVLMDEKAYENNLYYNSLYKNKQNFKIDGFIRVYDEVEI